ncbi:MAG TPA: prolipoprotein diacylglyceryl transferase family protein [Acidobacteriaceae bacterium]|nr:prolipoprotein diacylglyceryl transferase family protein [Acidobacteriaceae bacterium]
MYPRLFQFGPITLPTYGACLAIGLVAALFLALYTARRLRIEPESMWNLSMLVVFSALLGSKLLLLVANFRDFLHYPLLMLSLSITQSRSALLDGFILALLAGMMYIRAKKMPWLRTLDAAAPALALGDAFANLGAFAAGSGYGKPTALPWGVVYHSRWAATWSNTPLNIRLHPTQMYLCLVELFLCALLVWMLPRQRQDGEGIGSWLFLYGLALYGIDFFRGDVRYALFGGRLSLQQGIACVLVMAGALLWLERGTSQSKGSAPSQGIHVV